MFFSIRHRVWEKRCVDLNDPLPTGCMCEEIPSKEQKMTTTGKWLQWNGACVYVECVSIVLSCLNAIRYSWWIATWYHDRLRVFSWNRTFNAHICSLFLLSTNRNHPTDQYISLDMWSVLFNYNTTFMTSKYYGMHATVFVCMSRTKSTNE